MTICRMNDSWGWLWGHELFPHSSPNSLQLTRSVKCWGSLCLAPAEGPALHPSTVVTQVRVALGEPQTGGEALYRGWSLRSLSGRERDFSRGWGLRC